MVDSTGIITTVAGGSGDVSVSGFSGDGGQATSARLRNPQGVYVDQSGKIYIVDRGNHAIRMIDTTGTISTVAGNGTVSGFSGDGGHASSAKLSYPGGIYVDQSGRIYIADSSNNAIRMVDTGIITTVAGTGTVSGYSGDGGPASSAKLNTPYGVYVDQSGRIYIADYTNHAIRMVDTTGIISTVAGTGTASGGDGYGYGYGYGTNSGYSGDEGQASSAQLNNPRGVHVDQSGRIYIVDFNNHAIRMIDTTGIITTVAGGNGYGYSGDGGQASSAKLAAPSGVYVDQSSRVYIADRVNSAIRTFQG
jgi:streptogramin lyase